MQDILKTKIHTLIRKINSPISEKNALQTNIIGTNLLTKFHKDRKIYVASRVLTRKNAPPPWQPYIIGMNLLTNKCGRLVLTRFYYYSHITKNAPPLSSHTNLLTKFHEEWTINVASREKCPAPGGHVFKATKTISDLIQDIIGTNLLTMFHYDRQINVTSTVLTKEKCPTPVVAIFFQQTGIIFELFHEDRTINVASRVLTRFYYSHIRKNSPPLGSHVFQANVPIFELIQDINFPIFKLGIEIIKLLTKIGKDIG
ncbi:hypothetical protein DPMN_170236 [Dreissena polymorpha]|uniref:Uncharacterized protein n=1 Tax=Dreissena polymorpha TaxID=45954 RepID=A0A9D4DWN0_DREPO|nr:hypothetical protein DPMN_170236 [Dreissena polymorpha]